jgi:hypothetical protein
VEEEQQQQEEEEEEQGELCHRGLGCGKFGCKVSGVLAVCKSSRQQ